MTRGALVLRPEPGNAATCARLAAVGIVAVALPLFEVRPVAWSRPPGHFDALLLTSANAVRHGGALPDLPVVAVGEMTAAAARRVGLNVALTGSDDAAAAVAAARDAGFDRLLHLAGREHVTIPGVIAITVYASEVIDLPPGAMAIASNRIALLHSPRAARQFASLIDRDVVPRAEVGIAALSAAIADAAGHGWADCSVAPQPTDAALIAGLRD